MEISYEYAKHILDTLPIGYYLGRNIPVELSNNDLSYFDPIADKINIGYKSVEVAFQKADENKYNVDIEEVIRGILYHEISHVVLTPDALLRTNCNKRLLNIFEDERIETLLSKTYMNTNFKKNIIFLNGYDGTEKPKNAQEAFYYTVRYHNGKPQFVNRVAALIRQYAHINKMYGDSFGREYDINVQNELNIIRRYAQDIIALYNDIAEDFEKEKDKKQNLDNTDKSESETAKEHSNTDEQNQDSSSDNNSTNDSANDLDNDSDNNVSDEAEEQENQTNTNIENSEDIGDNENQLTDKQVEDLIDDIDVKMTDEELKSIFKDAVKSVLEVINDPVLSARIKKIIEDKIKQDNKNGAAISAYSGRFDPRAIARRDDYKWWTQQNVNGDIRRFSKLHFNLFIDNSGSFSNNDFNMNKFIQALNKVVGKDFDFDVITINTQVVEWPDTKSCVFKSSGSNSLHAEIAQAVKRHTKMQSNNYNIILFDGDAQPDLYSDGSNAFKFFDGPNTILVTDQSNEKYVNKAMKQAKVIVTTNYCNMFIDTVCTLLERTI